MFCLPACHVTINQAQRTVNMQMSYLTYYLKISGVLEGNILGERASADKKNESIYYI